jgi:hypothetical protein
MYLTLLYLTLPFFVSLPSLQTRPLNRFARTISQTTRIAPRKCLLGVSSMKNIFTGKYPFPKIFKGHFTCKSKKSNNFGLVKDNRKIPKPTYTKSGSSNRTVTSLPVQHAPSGRNRLSAIFGNNKSANNVETVQDRR